MSYKNKHFQQILEIVQNYNCKALGLENIRELATRQLSAKEKKSASLDIVTGFVLIDEQSRMIVLEGVQEGGMKYFEEQVNELLRND